MTLLTAIFTLISATAIGGALIAVATAWGYTSVWVIVAAVPLALIIAYPGARIAAGLIRAMGQARSTSTDPTE